jgi:hypothetical protein
MVRFAIPIFLGAFLLFQVQPMIGKYILPWFGGTPAVWTTCMLFFQMLLLAGYGYAHFLDSRLSPRRQAGLHLALLLVSVGVLIWQAVGWPAPILPGEDFKPTGSDHPVARILVMLSLGVGLPFLLLSATSPLLQAWVRTSLAGKSPYRLYGLSNAGSLLALLSYPVLVEPWLPIGAQAWVWAAIYGTFVIACGLAASKILGSSGSTEGEAAAGDADGPEVITAKPSWGLRLLWLCLAACGSSLLLAVTNQMSQEVAVIPFLWILPLALYLLSFILTFEKEGWYLRRVFGPGLFVTMGLAVVGLFIGARANIYAQIVSLSLCLFVACMVCHGELVRLKPHPRYLTWFYLMVSLGGALGGVFVGLVAPLVFTGFWELHVSLFACVALFLLVNSIGSGAWMRQGRIVLRVGAAVILLGALAAALLALAARERLVSVFADRSFYGVLRVEEEGRGTPYHRFDLIDGVTLHGSQFTAANLRTVPTITFTRESGIGMLLEHHPRERTTLRMGIIGLGIGTLAAYGRAGDTVRYYEINPLVALLAEGKGGYFSYLRDSPARTEVVLGDARTTLEKERGSTERFDVLVVDAFSSGSIPVHLLTLEAVRLYRERLTPDGTLALHLSNNHLDLARVVLRIAAEENLPAVRYLDEGKLRYGLPSKWILLTTNTSILGLAAFADKVIQPGTDAAVMATGLWTDDFSNLFEILK